MNNPRIVIVVLILLAILFVIGISYGLLRDDKKPNSNNTGIAVAVKQAPAWVKQLGAMLGSRSAKLTSKDFVDSKYSTEPVRLAISNVAPISVAIRSSDEAYRKALFRLIGVGRIDYRNDCPPQEVTDADARQKLQEQSLNLSGPVKPLNQDGTCQDDDNSCGRLTILKCGGTLTFTCLEASCQVELLQ